MQKHDAIKAAQAYLAKQERTESGLYKELIKHDCPPEIAKSALEHAVSNSWVSDERYCLRYCERQLCKGYGPIKITEDLRDKGPTTTAIIKAIAEVEFATWEHAAMVALEKKFGRDYRAAPRAQVIGYLERRGFNDEYMLFLLKEE